MAKKDLTKSCILIAVLAAIFLPGFAKYQDLRNQNATLKNKIEALRKENNRLREERKRLETDTVYTERKAREKMGVIRKGEIIYRVVPEEEKKQ